MANALPITKGGGVTVAQIHAEHVQLRFVVFQDYTPQLLPINLLLPFAEMAIHGFIMQHPPCEEG